MSLESEQLNYSNGEILTLWEHDLWKTPKEHLINKAYSFFFDSSLPIT